LRARLREATGGRDALWVLFTIFVVLQREARASLDFAAVRPVGTFAGIGVLTLLTEPLGTVTRRR
jgi:hypothetical protein